MRPKIKAMDVIEAVFSLIERDARAIARLTAERPPFFLNELERRQRMLEASLRYLREKADAHEKAA